MSATFIQVALLMIALSLGELKEAKEYMDAVLQKVRERVIHFNLISSSENTYLMI